MEGDALPIMGHPRIKAAILFAAALLSGCAAGAQATPTSPAPLTHVLRVPFTLIETQCSGGIAGRLTRYDLRPDGRIGKATGVRIQLIRAGSMTAEEARDLSRRLDMIGFDTLKLPRPARPVADGITCSIARTRSGKRHVVTTYHPGTPSSPVTQEIASIRTAIQTAADQAPQP